jgi:hypothetical protein
VIRDLYEQLEQALADRSGGLHLDLPAPATEEELAAAEQLLGIPLPADLRALLQVHDGGFVIGNMEWLSVAPAPWTIVEATSLWRDLLLVDDFDPSRLGYVPQPDFLIVADGSHRGLGYEVSGPTPGSIFYAVLDSTPQVVPVSPSLEAYLRLHVRLAELGYVHLERDADESVVDVFDELGVSIATESGISWWMQHTAAGQAFAAGREPGDRQPRGGAQ